MDAYLVSKLPNPRPGHEVRKDNQEERHRSISIECLVGRVPLQAGLTTWSAVRVCPGEPLKIRPNPKRIGPFTIWTIWRLTLAFWAYIIQSESTDRYYCGHSSDPNRRLRQLNDPEYRLSKATKGFEVSLYSVCHLMKVWSFKPASSISRTA